MKVQETVRRETRRIAGGTLVLTGVMLMIFAILGKMDMTVILGGAIGCGAAVLDFFLLGLTVQKAAEMQATLPPQPETEETDGDEPPPLTPAQQELSANIRRRVQLSHSGRMLMLVAFAALGLLPFISLPAVVIPMLFPKLVIYAGDLFPRRGKEE